MVILNSILVCSINLFYYSNSGVNLIPYSVVLISFLASFLLLFNYRLLIKYIFSFYNRGILKNSKVLIFGSGQTGIITKHVIDSSPSSEMGADSFAFPLSVEFATSSETRRGAMVGE